MRVLYSFPHAFGAQGIGWTAWNQVVELVAAGHEVHLVAASIERDVPTAASTRTTMTVLGRRVPHRAIGRDRALARHDRIVSRMVSRNDYDIVHAWPLASRRTLVAARARGVPGLREIPNTHTAHAYAVVSEEMRLLGLSSMTPTAHTYDAKHLAMEEGEWAAAAALLVPSEPVRKTFLDRGFDAQVLLRHQYGYRPSGRTGTVRDADPDRPLTVVFVGRGEPRKGLHYALRAWHASTASERGRFLVAGEMIEEYRAVLGDLLDGPGVELLGFLDDVSAVYAEADVLVLPTIEEGSALVTYESQAAGCVLLVSSAAGALMSHGVEGLVHEPRDVAALTSHLDLLDGDRSELQRLSAAAVAHAPMLTWAAACTRLTEAYAAAVQMAAR